MLISKCDTDSRERRGCPSRLHNSKALKKKKRTKGFCSAPVFLNINTVSRLDFLTSTLRSLGYLMQITNHQRALTHLQSFSSRPSPAAGCLDRRELRFPGGERAVVFGKMAVCAPHSSWVSQLALLEKVQHGDSLVKRNR